MVFYPCVPAPKVITLGLQNPMTYQAGDYKIEVCREFARLCEQHTGGRLVLKHYYCGDVYPSYRDMTVALMAQEAEVLYVGDSVPEGLGVREAVIPRTPYFGVDWDTRVKNHKLIYSDPEAGGKIKSLLRDKGAVHLISTPCAPVVFVINTKAETEKALGKVKVRTPNVSVYVKVAKAAFLSPTPLAYSEAPMALKTGVVDGLLTDSQSLVTARFWELGADHFISNLTPFGAFYAFYVSTTVWDEKLPTDIREIVENKVMPEIYAWAVDRNRKDLAEGLEIIKENMVIYEIPPSVLKTIKERAATTIHPDFEAINPEIFAAMKRICGF
ncbi:C4-dicarboxylate-binding periplasmic protein DctP [subsurface metagenome]